jgi:hypothetical protein
MYLRSWQHLNLRSFVVTAVVAGILLVIFNVNPASAASIRPAKSVKTGVSTFQLMTPGDTDIAADRVAEAGGSYLLAWARWDLIAPRVEPRVWNPSDPSDTNYNWESVDNWVAGIAASGLAPIVQVYGSPVWANRCSPSKGAFVIGGAPCNPDPNKMAEFLKAAAHRYSGTFSGLPKVKFWQVQNEPNLQLFFNPQFGKNGQAVSPRIYRKLLASSYKALKSVNPSNVVLAAGLAPNGVAGAVAPLSFARKLLCMNKRNRPIPAPNACKGGVKLDALDMHPYTSGGPTHKAVGTDNVQMGNLPELSRLLKAADEAGHIVGGRKKTTPLWITEMSWDSNPPDPGGVPMKILTRWTAEAVYRSWKAGVSVFLWYSLHDHQRGSGGWSASDQSGLYFRGETLALDTPKPSLKAFRFPFVSYSLKKGASFWGRNPTSDPGKVVIQLKKGSAWRRLAVAKANSNGLFRGFVKSRLASEKRGVVRAIFRGDKSPTFSLKPVKDFYQRPFG